VGTPHVEALVLEAAGVIWGFVAMGVAAAFLVRWAWRFELRVLWALGHRGEPFDPHGREPADGPGPWPATLDGASGPGRVPGDAHPARARRPSHPAGRQPGSEPLDPADRGGVGRAALAGVLAWKRLRLLSVLADGGTVILACRRHPAALFGPIGGGRGIGARPDPGATGRRRRVRPSRGSEPVGAGALALAPDDRTIVLALGDGEAANMALSLLERWCQEGVWLHVRPAWLRRPGFVDRSPGAPLEVNAVELLDTGQNSLRAPLAAA